MGLNTITQPMLARLDERTWINQASQLSFFEDEFFP